MGIQIEKGIISLSRFRASCKESIESLRDGSRSIVLTQKGKATAVVLSPQEYDKLQQQEVRNLIASRIQEIANHQFVEDEIAMWDELESGGVVFSSRRSWICKPSKPTLLKSPQATKRLIKKFRQSTDRLKEFPRIGRVIPELQNPDLREILVDGYRIMYQLDGPHVNVFAVYQSQRPYPSLEDSK